jgi:hypothetical protein
MSLFELPIKAGPVKVNSVAQKFECGLIKTEAFTSASDLSILYPSFLFNFNEYIVR